MSYNKKMEQSFCLPEPHVGRQGPYVGAQLQTEVHSTTLEPGLVRSAQ